MNNYKTMNAEHKLNINDFFSLTLKSFGKRKKRLLIAIIFGFLSFSLFGMVDTIFAFDRANVVSKTLAESQQTIFQIYKKSYIGDTLFYTSLDGTSSTIINLEDMTNLKNKTGIEFAGSPESAHLKRYVDEEKLSENTGYTFIFHNYCELLGN